MIRLYKAANCSVSGCHHCQQDSFGELKFCAVKSFWNSWVVGAGVVAVLSIAVAPVDSKIADLHPICIGSAASAVANAAAKLISQHGPRRWLRVPAFLATHRSKGVAARTDAPMRPQFLVQISDGVDQRNQPISNRQPIRHRTPLIGGQKDSSDDEQSSARWTLGF